MKKVAECFLSWFVILTDDEFLGIYHEEYRQDAFYRYCIEEDGWTNFEGEIPSEYQVDDLTALPAKELVKCSFRHWVNIYYEGMDKDRVEGITLEELKKWELVGPNETVFITPISCDDYKRNEKILKYYF